jgi:hypothetical protein
VGESAKEEEETAASTPKVGVEKTPKAGVEEEPKRAVEDCPKTPVDMPPKIEVADCAPKGEVVGLLKGCGAKGWFWFWF